ncbi:hypothetical protein N657DRAFT_430024 [Parathielavia appendiculata]|uniref:Uncharacterized protein n=1 Tax=Parathielavia appendiculata TaxID=2587402 RepID=A0AAN6TZW4_9PEZI|nr:hypothetical protein N657DRAFT_430024 [Parathielavia appendiculata]
MTLSQLLPGLREHPASATCSMTIYPTASRCRRGWAKFLAARREVAGYETRVLLRGDGGASTRLVNRDISVRKLLPKAPDW